MKHVTPQDRLVRIRDDGDVTILELEARRSVRLAVGDRFRVAVGDEQVVDEVHPCIFEPRCLPDPSRCSCTFGRRPHLVYVAFHGAHAKVGMTSADRLHARLREQGADAGFRVALAPDRATARRLERQVGLLTGISEFRRIRDQIRSLARPVAWARIDARAGSLRAALARFYTPGELVRITNHSLRPPLQRVPAAVQGPGIHAGTWLGSKGDLLVYETAPGAMADAPAIRAIRAGDMVGRRITFGGEGTQDPPR